MKDYAFLIKCADVARENAHAPYSGFKVGAALLASDGKIFTGCNIENAAYGETICAERVAFFKAISEGERSFEAIAIVGGDKGSVCAPCGSCRQVMSEFCADDFKIVLGSGDKVYSLAQLLPLKFGGDTMR